MSDEDISQDLAEAVRQAAAGSTHLRIVGGDSKAFYGREPLGEPLAVGAHRGVLSYEPTELVITARCGTPLAEIEAALDEKGQMLGFEPPAFGESATLGGTVACGLSGPRRPYAGSARDFVLGVRVLNGRGEILRFGGQVMKNVAGYDLSRLLTGSLGILGVILDVSLRVLPRPVVERTLVQSLSLGQGIEALTRWSGKPYPLSAAAHDGERLYLRLSGARAGVDAAARVVGGEDLEDGGAFWFSLREQTLPFFQGSGALWRLSLPPATPPLGLEGEWFLDWGGAQRWLRSDAPAGQIRKAATEAGGHASLFRGGDRQGQVFQPLDAVLQRLHRNLKASFDPQGVFNPGRLYAEL